MECTQEQYEKDLKKPLEELGCEGINLHSRNFMKTYVCGHINSLYSEDISKEDAHFIDHYNTELFLALAAMTEGEEPIVGEYVKSTNSIDGDRIFKIKKITSKLSGNISIGVYGSCSYSICRKATKEELIKHFSKDVVYAKSLKEDLALTNEDCKEIISKMRKKERFPFQLDLEGARKIIDVACSDWEDKLLFEWKDLFLEKATGIFIGENSYKEMRKACNDEQHKVLDEVFGKDEKSVEKEIGVILHNCVLDYGGEIELDCERGITFKGVNKDKFTKQLLETFDIKFKE